MWFDVGQHLTRLVNTLLAALAATASIRLWVDVVEQIEQSPDLEDRD